MTQSIDVADDFSDEVETGLPDDEAFTQRLRFVIDQAGSIAALAKRIDMSSSGVQRYLAGGQPTRRVLIAIAQTMGISLLWLMTGEGSPARSDTLADPHQGIRSLTRLPIYLAGNSKPMDEAKTTAPRTISGLGFCRFWLGQHGMEPGDLKGIYMSGDSMAPTILPGDTLLINIVQRQVIDGNIYAFRQDDAVLIKRVQLEPGNLLRLISDNSRYADTRFDATELECVGRVVWRGSLF
ncbi:S24 family peptidase [Tsuneonella sp. CC-YZS046]|uniref:S24 family peptidase n=1 Tax=Tsuneonella sp. CC-YZS046 TaxID=3042152 RepID=UPI002D7A2578|nr:S24 family peptidase [Tsuneonella sp. CC-YZS046]WRO66623.1 S24 family peptidase [Tsuneonella sp. CC-YZS046]